MTRPAAERRVRLTLFVLVALAAVFMVVTQFGGAPVTQWGGLLLTAFLAVGGIALSFPLGVLLALGRRSTLPGVRIVCVVYIELMRGHPLVALERAGLRVELEEERVRDVEPVAILVRARGDVARRERVLPLRRVAELEALHTGKEG